MFTKTYCIHLPNSVRRAAMEAEFQRIGIANVEYVHATPPRRDFAMSNMRRAPAAEFGVGLSHLKALTHAIRDGVESALFVEDDVVFRQPLDTVELPEEWDIVYFGGHPREPVKMVSASVARVGRFSFAEAYAVRGSVLPRLVDFWCDRIGQPAAMYDFILGEFAAANAAYCTYPLLTEQPPNVSQVSGKFDDKRQLVARGWASNLT